MQRNTIRHSLLTLFVLLPLLAACGGKDTTGRSIEELVTITFACLESAENDYRNLAEQFEADLQLNTAVLLLRLLQLQGSNKPDQWQVDQSELANRSADS